MNEKLALIEAGIEGYDPSSFVLLDDLWRGLVGNWNYYRWLWSAVKVLQPKYVVEIGRERGVSANIMLTTMPADSKLVSIDIIEESIFLVNNADPRLIQITEDSLTAWKHLEPGIDFLFIDGEHTKEHVEKEWEYYSPLLAPGATVAFDDIHFDEGMTQFWDGLQEDKYDISNWHERGFGVLFR